MILASILLLFLLVNAAKLVSSNFPWSCYYMDSPSLFPWTRSAFKVSYLMHYAGTWLVHVVFRVPFPWTKLGKGWKHVKGIVKPDRFSHFIAHLHFSFVWLVDGCQGSVLVSWFTTIYYLILMGSNLQSGLQRLWDYPQPFWLALFVEGTRFTQAKLLAAQEYAASSGLPVPKNVLIPRTKVGTKCYFLSLCSVFGCWPKHLVH